jgi:hypothetical protein
MSATETEVSKQAASAAAAAPTPAELESAARRMGWRPKEEFHGAEADWVDAKTFVDNGKRILPIVNANLARERERNAALQTELEGTKSRVAELSQTVDSLKTFQAEVAHQQRERIRAEEMAKLKAAREVGDVEAEVKALDKIAETREEPVEAKARTVVADAQAKANGVDHEAEGARRVQRPVTPTAREWAAENSWFGTDPVKTDVALGINARLAAQGGFEGLDERQRLDLIARETLKHFNPAPPAAAAAASRVEGGGRSAEGGGDAGGGGFDNLPADVRAAADEQGERLGLIGPNKAFKTKAEWREYYARVYG